MSNIAFYNRLICPIGGIETWLYYVSSGLCKHHKLTLFYEDADKQQIERLESVGVTCIRYTHPPKETFDVLFKGYDGDPQIKAKKYIQTIHACFSEIPTYKFNAWKKTDRYLAVSERAKESFLELYPDEKLPIDVIPNFVPPTEINPTKPFKGTINMVIASRLTQEKGLKYVIDMIKELDKRQIPYHIDLHTVFQRMPHMTNGKVSCVPLSLNIDFSKYHYLIQLSDSESYCFSVHEALAAGTAVITKDLPVFKGIVKHGYNGYIYPDIEHITDIPVRFDYKPTGSIEVWLKYIDSIV